MFTRGFLETQGKDDGNGEALRYRKGIKQDGIRNIFEVDMHFLDFGN